MRKWLGCCIWLAMTACVSNEEKFSEKMEFEPIEGIAERVNSTEARGITQAGGVEWYSCKLNQEAPTVLLLNLENDPFSEQVCSRSIVQAFLSEKYSVIAVNRPGHGKSPGRDMLGDDPSLAALNEAIGELTQQTKLSGLWAFEEASVLAFRLAKVYPFQWIIVGNGIYDWEATLAESADPQFVSRLRKLQEGQDGRFPEARSIAWDYAGLPKSVYLYHSATAKKVPEAHAGRFRAALAAAEYKVELMSLKEENANLNPNTQQAIIRQILEALKPAK